MRRSPAHNYSDRPTYRPVPARTPRCARRRSSPCFDPYGGPDIDARTIPLQSSGPLSPRSSGARRRRPAPRTLGRSACPPVLVPIGPAGPRSAVAPHVHDQVALGAMRGDLVNLELVLAAAAVSYTHLTLPTNRDVSI